MSAPVHAAGLDGCRGGWAVVTVDAHGTATLSVARTVFEVAVRHPEALLAIDIPIGLTDGPREADTAARRVLGAASASVFNAPPRTLVDDVRAGAIATYEDANARARAVSGKGLSRQTWNITEKVAEVDRLADTAGDRLLEVHPEVSFATLAGGTSLASKHSALGVRQRLRLLDGVGLAGVTEQPPAGRLAFDDVLDAAVAAWTAHGSALGAGLRSYPTEPSQYDRGRPVAIWVRQPPASADGG